jgi:hypothetical protein
VLPKFINLTDASIKMVIDSWQGAGTRAHVCVCVCVLGTNK